MAPVPEAYFPSLDKCFSGDVQLLSWKRAFLYTCSPSNHDGDVGGLHAFLSHPESARLLSQCPNPFPPPSAKSKSEFESKTAAIHAETTTQSSYDLKEIKSDSLWLSQKANIDEITALRITVLEWQSRPTTRLLTSFSEEEATSLQNAAEVDNFRVSTIAPSFSRTLRQNADRDQASDFNSEEYRRLRLRELYLSERCHILKTARKLLSFSLRDNIPNIESPSPRRCGDDRLASLSKLAATIFKRKSIGAEWSQFLGDCIDATRNRLASLGGDGGWLGADESNEDVENIWRTTFVEEILHILQLLFLELQASPAIPNSKLLLSWLRLMAEYSFLESLQAPCADPVEVLLPLRVLVSTISLAFLKLPLTMPFIVNRNEPGSQEPVQTPYFLSKPDISEINGIFLDACESSRTASTAAFSWGLVLNTMRELALKDRENLELEQLHSAVDSFQSNTPNATPTHSEQSLYEEALDSARTPQYTIDDAISLLTCESVKDRAFDIMVAIASKAGQMSAIDDDLTDRWIRVALLDLIRVSVVYLDYSTEIVQSVLAILTGSHPDSIWYSELCPTPASDPRYLFLKDPILMDSIFRVARSRFPYETTPFLKLCRALICKDTVNEDGLPVIVDELENMDTYTQVVSSNFQGYETIREDENANFVSLLQPLPMFESSTKLLSNYEASSALVVTGASQIPPATIGQVVSESRPAVIMWQHQYSCLSYLGSRLEELSEAKTLPEWDEDSAADIIMLLADIIAPIEDGPRHGNVGPGGKKELEIVSDGLHRQNDIISVIYDIFERNLQNVGLRAGEGTFGSTIACLHFIRNLTAVLPNRVWPLLARSALLGSDGTGSAMTAIVSALEVASGDYQFLLSCIGLFQAVIEDAASHAAMRKNPNSVTTKSITVSDWSAGVPAHVMRNVLLNFVQTMVDIYNSNVNWRFNDPGQRFRINTALATTFERILYYAYGANNTTSLDAKVTGVFSSSAQYLTDVLRPRSTDDLPFNPIIRLVVDGLQTPSTLYLRYLTLMTRQVKSTLKLSIKLVQVAQLMEYPVSLLEDQLFKATPVLTKLYAMYDEYRLPVVSLLDILVSSAASDTAKEPPSLVGHLGAESSCLFLDLLAQFDKPFNNRPLLLAIWQLVSTFVSRRQQWLAVYILTGSSPRQSLKKAGSEKAPEMRGVAFLQTALDTLSHMEQAEPQVALAMLQFISHSQEHWPWATPELRKHPNFLNGVISHVSKMKIATLPVMDQIFATRTAAVVADLCAVYLHYAKEAHDRSFSKMLIPLVFWYAKDAVEVSGYNASLHANLKKNFEMRYSGCKLIDFKRTSLEPRSLGPNYYYDIDLGGKLLSYDFAWAGNRSQGFAEEFERANINLSLVEAQVSLLHSWKFFAIEHCADFMADREIQKSMSSVVRQCLVANTRGVPQEAIFERIQQVRLDFARALLQRLVEIGAKGTEVFGLLGAVWEAMLARHSSYEDALVNDDTEYYRSLLNVLFLALQFHVNTPSRAAPEVVTKKAEVSSDLNHVTEVVKTVVAQGFKSLTTYLHDQPHKCTPKDFAIVTAILQSCLQVKNVDRIFGHMAFHIEDNDAARYAATLFSWSDQLAIDGDPVYGELSISFLVKLSSLPTLAEYLAVEAILAQLSTCRLTNILCQQPKGFGPFDTTPRLYSIWATGFLPLCMNLLYHVIRTAPEVAAFLNQFEGQLARASGSFAATSRVTFGPGAAVSQQISLGMASEAYSLALISFILDRLREAGPSAGVDGNSIQELKWDKTQVKEDIEALLERRSALRARIVATSDKEAEMVTQKPVQASSGAENRLEEKLVGQLRAALTCLGGEEA